MKFLIIGGGGFVGSWLTHRLISKKHHVVVIDPFIYNAGFEKKRSRIIQKFKKEVLLKGAKLYRKRFEDGGSTIMKKEKPDVVIHLAGIPLEQMNNFEISLKQLTNDVGLTYHIVKAVKEHGVKKFVYMSSIAAYGDCEDVIVENSPLIPKTPYGIVKASGEFITQAELDNWNIVRSTNIYGFGDMNERASNIIIDKILKKDHFWINKKIIMDFIHVKDLAQGLIDVALKAPAKEIFHVSGGNALALTQYVTILKKYFSFEYEIKELNDRPKRGTMDNKKARKLIGWYPRLDIEKGIKDYMNYVKKYKIA